MDNKKSFGQYLTQKRKEMGLTQKSFADKLFVTESAVSKWERGLSYPDISLIVDICEILKISEREFLTASEDTQTRNTEKQAKKYVRLLNRYKYMLYFVYGISILICFICNLAIEHRLSWFFIVLTGILFAASITLLPVITEKNRGLITLAGFTLSLLLLLLTCNIYTGGDWLFITLPSVIFGLSVLFLPFVINNIWLPKPLSEQKTLLCFSIDTALLFLMLFVCDIYTHGGWFFNIALPITAFSLILPWAMMIIIRYTSLNNFFKASACFALGAVFEYFIQGIINITLGIKPDSFGFQYNFRNWSDTYISGNINAIIFFTLLGIAVLFLIAGILVNLQASPGAKKEA